MDKNYAWDKNCIRNEQAYLWNGIKQSSLNFYIPNPFISLYQDNNNTKSNELKIVIKKNPIKFNFNL